ncbi:MAG: amino acid-binding protein [Candidatus Bathyarchaeota archaeon]|nr:amino acid-binding protein [Candidatus Bathyarchaeum tardum]WGM89086.1 MAG: amino acid-binding protein [Candidatus Bathyarchaeum tardum]WNZ28679.1 MAG: amino acid-binding protein [Candidatus Bathyarchaeota archaeon]
MWGQIKHFFDDFPAQQRIALLLFERGFQVNEDGKVVSGRIEIPHTQIAKEVGVERRAVDSTVQTILVTPELKRIYKNLRQVCSLQDVAREFNYSVIVFVPENANQTGIVSNVTRIVSEKGLGIRQVLAEDPSTSSLPKLTLILEGDIPSELINQIRKLPGTRSITVY